MRFVAGGDAVAELLLAGTPWQSCCWQGRCGGVAGGGAAAERLCGRVPESAGNVSPWIAAAAKKPPVTALWGTRYWERAVRRILFAGFEALCVFGYLELVYHLLNLTIHKDRKVVG